MGSLESLTGSVTISYEGLTQEIEQPFVISQEKVWIDSATSNADSSLDLSLDLSD